MLEARAGEAKADARGDFAKIQALRERFGLAQQAFGGAAQIDRARKKRLRAFLPWLEHVDGRARRKRGKKFILALRIEIEAAIQLQRGAGFVGGRHGGVAQ